jgi:uncharacterized membrane protein
MVEETASPAPDLRPGVGSAYGNGWRQTWKNFADLLLAGIIYVVMTVPVGIVIGLIFSLGWSNSFQTSFDFFGAGTATATIGWGAQLVNGIVDVLYFTPLMYGLLFLALLAARRDRPDLNNLFVVFKTNYANVIVVGVIFWVIFNVPAFILAWITDIAWPIGILLSIAWFFAAIVLFSRLMFTPFLLTDKKLGATQAINKSWEMTRGHALENFLIVLLGIPVLIAGLIVFVVGVIPAIMIVAVAVASQYQAVSLEKSAPVVYPSPLVP